MEKMTSFISEGKIYSSKQTWSSKIIRGSVGPLSQQKWPVTLS